MLELEVDTSSGLLSATLNAPDGAHCALLLAHGAGADHKHVHMESLACAFASAGIATLRFNFPFKQQGKSRVDSQDVSVDCIVQAAKLLKNKVALPLFLGGHSFGGRMVTHAVAQGAIHCQGLVLCSFPLHPAGKPSTKRVEHFKELDLPMLFLSGTRDSLADPKLLEGEAGKVNAELIWLDTADHGFKILKRTRESKIDVYTEAAESAAKFTVASA